MIMLGAPDSSLLSSLVGALEGTASILLTFLAGYVVAYMGLIDHHTIKHVSNLCSNLLLPCLILVQMGPQFTAGELRRVWIIPAWGLASTVVAHAIAWLGCTLFKLPWWVIAAAGRPNSSAMPLLLLQALANTGVLSTLSDTPPEAVVSRAQALILLNVVIQETLTIQTAPALLEHDRAQPEATPGEEDGPDRLAPAKLTRGSAKINPVVQNTARIGLIQDMPPERLGRPGEANASDYTITLHPILDRPEVYSSGPVRSARALMRRLKRVLSPPLIAAIIAFILGIVPALHDIFYSNASPVHASVIQALKNLGDLFVVLQMFIVGADLAVIPNAHPGFANASFSMLVRFAIMPGLSLLFVWFTAGRGLYTDDKLVWFLLILLPAGPSATLLLSVAEQVDVDQGPVAAFLTISYLFSPLMAAICSLGLVVVDSAWHRIS